MAQVPAYLHEYEQLYMDDPRQAAREWFASARYGLFLHYGLYSLLKRHEWVQYREKIYVDEYARLREDFTAENFDADYICELACDAGMSYINITTRHHDSFSLWETAENEFHSAAAPCRRDLIGELSEACDDYGLGLCLYYSHGRDWRHPHAPNNDEYPRSARPEYDPPEPTYAYGDDHDLTLYVEFMWNQITELLNSYGPIAAIWLDGWSTPLSGHLEPFELQTLYDHIHDLQPQVLVSYKWGITGTEDFFAPEHDPAEDHLGELMEICTTMCPGSWGYYEEKAGTHLDADDVWEQLRQARENGCNLLLNTGPLPDGSIDPEDEPVLREVGRRLREEGFPGE